MYLKMLRASILPAIHQLYVNEPFYFQQDGATTLPPKRQKLPRWKHTKSMDRMKSESGVSRKLT
jgi:hypothetical protein